MGKLQVENKADVNMVEASGHTALFVAVERGHRKIAEVLVEHGADVNAQDPREISLESLYEIHSLTGAGGQCKHMRRYRQTRIHTVKGVPKTSEQLCGVFNLDCTREGWKHMHRCRQTL